MSNFKIEKGIPLPSSVGKPRKYDIPLADMDVDDHVKIDLARTKINNEKKIISNFVLRYQHKNPEKRFTVRKLEDGVGIWRVR
jgi:ribosomal protein L19